MSIKQKLKNIPFRLITSSSDRLIIRFEKDRLKVITSKQNTSSRLEIINKGKLGYSSSTEINEDFLVQKALSSSRFGDKVDYDYPRPQRLAGVKQFSKKLASTNIDYFLTLGKDLIHELKSINSKILVDVVIDKSINDSTLEISSGLMHQEQNSSWGVGVAGELVSEGDILSIDEDFTWRDLDFDKQKFINKLKTRFNNSNKIVSINSGDYTVIFTPPSLNTLLGFVEIATSAQTVYKKVSKWQDQINKQVTDPRLSIYDNPLVDYALGTTNLDDEGNAAGKLTLIENGVLKSFYTDLKNASRLSLAPNGRGFGIPSDPALTNVMILPGDKSTAQIIKSQKKAILVEQIIGGGQDSPYSGDFSFNIHLGFLIEKGEIIGRVKNALVSGNIFEMLKNQLGEISSDPEWYGGCMHLPHISFEKIKITTS